MERSVISGTQITIEKILASFTVLVTAIYMISGVQTFASDSNTAVRSPFNFTALSNDPVLVEVLTKK